MMRWNKDKAILEGDYIYLEGDEGMKRKWRTKRRDVAYSSGCPRNYGWHEGCQDTAGHGVKKSWMGPFLYSDAYVLNW